MAPATAGSTSRPQPGCSTGWTALGLGSVTVDGRTELAVVDHDTATGVDVTVASGRLPAGEHQIALGTRTAAHLGVGVGDDVDLQGDGIEPRRAKVTGLVVLPALGAYQADRTGPGTGVLVPAAMLPPDLAAGSVSFVGIDLVAGDAPEAARAALHDDFADWDTLGYDVFDYAAPVRPAEITDARSMRTVPLLVGGLLGLAGVVGLTAAVVTSVRSRRRDLAILRALGFTGRQVRNAVRVQAAAAMAAALAVGLPLGVVAGRLAWQTFATQLGVATDPTVPLLGTAAVAVGGLVLAVLVAAVPARMAVRADPATVLRSE